jgi:hypothetical protein
MNPCPSPLPRKLTEADAIALGALPHLEMPQMMLTETEIKAIERLSTTLLDLKYWHTTALDHVNKQIESAQEAEQALQALTDLNLFQFLKDVAHIKKRRAELKRPLADAETIALIQTVRPEPQGAESAKTDFLKDVADVERRLNPEHSILAKNEEDQTVLLGYQPTDRAHPCFGATIAIGWLPLGHEMFEVRPNLEILQGGNAAPLLHP